MSFSAPLRAFCLDVLPESKPKRLVVLGVSEKSKHSARCGGEANGAFVMRTPRGNTCLLLRLTLNRRTRGSMTYDLSLGIQIRTEWANWRHRLAAFGSLPAAVRLIWDASPRLVCSDLILRVVSAVVPVASLWVAKLIIDRVAGRGGPPRGDD